MAAYVKKMNIMFEDELATTSVKHIKGYGKFLSSKVVEVDGQKYTGKHILIACGGDSSILDIPGRLIILGLHTFIVRGQK